MGIACLAPPLTSQVTKMVFASTTELGCMSKKRMKRFIAKGKLSFPIDEQSCYLEREFAPGHFTATDIHPVYEDMSDLEGSGYLPANWEGTNWFVIGHEDYKGDANKRYA